MKKYAPVILLIIVLALVGGFFLATQNGAPVEVDMNIAEQIQSDETQKDNEEAIVTGDRPELSCKRNKYLTPTQESLRSGYFKKNNKIYFYNGREDILISEADAQTFECLPAYRGYTDTRFYGKDKDTVYFGTSVIEGADPTSFDLFESKYYSKDANHVYAEGVLLEDADPVSFKFLNVDYGSLSIDGKSSPRYYAQDNVNVYVNQTTLPNSDPETYVQVGRHGYSKDKNNVYLFDKVIISLDPATFEHVVGGAVDSAYFKDKNFVYYRDMLIEGADASTFVAILYDEMIHGVIPVGDVAFEPHVSYAYDNEHYYADGKIIGNRNAPDFRIINDVFLLNKNHLLWGNKDIVITDPTNLEYVDAGYFKDSVHVYSTWREPIGILEDVPPDQFDIYYSDLRYASGGEGGYGNYFIREGDMITVFYSFYIVREAQLVGVDANTFELIRWPYAKDKQSVFMRNQKVEGADPLTFAPLTESLTEQYATDKNNVYYGSKQLEGADVGSFHTQEFEGLRFSLGVDDNNVYYRATKLEGVNPLEITIEMGGAIIRDTDTAWYWRGSCHSRDYIPESEVPDPENYRPPC